MKKWLMIALAVTSFSLAACEDEETVTDNSVALVEDQEVVEEPEKLSGKPYEGYDSVETVNANTLVSKAPVDEQALRNAIKEALYDYSGNPKMDGVLSYYTAEEMVEMVRAHSGYEIDLNNLPFKGKDHASIQEFITYENGHFYIYPR